MPSPHSTTVTESSVALVEVQIVEFGERAEPVRVDVEKRTADRGGR